MLKFIYERFLKPKSRKNIAKNVDSHIYRRNARLRAKNDQAKNGLATLTNIPSAENKMAKVRMVNLLREEALSKRMNPTYLTSGKGVTFVVPFQNNSSLQNVKTRLNVLASTNSKNRGEFSNVSITNIHKSHNNIHTLIFTLSSNKDMSISLPPFLVRKLFGVNQPLHRKNEITKTDLIQWSKYKRYGQKVKKVHDLINVNKEMKTKNNEQLYELWNLYGDIIASEVNKMTRVIDPQNIPLVLGSNMRQDQVLKIILQQAMNQYLKFESFVYTKKSEIDVRPLFQTYIAQKGNDLPVLRRCNIPSDWSNAERALNAKQFFYTIGSIRYPNYQDHVCPFTRRHMVYMYTLKNRKKDAYVHDDDPWMQTLSSREGFSELLKRAHNTIAETLRRLVDYFERVYKKQIIIKSNGDLANISLNTAWDLYTICKTCRLNEHPLFRICAGFDAIGKHNTEFMNQFRYMVHNRPATKRDAGSYKISRQDSKCFFLSRDVAQVNATKNNDNNTGTNARNQTNSQIIYKQAGSVFPAHHSCNNQTKPFIDEGLARLLENKSRKNVARREVVAWPSLEETIVYYSKL